MAEFKEIMKIRERMCEGMEDCSDCPLYSYSDCKTPRRDELEKYEKAIVQWAAEHPEPRYPTWEEWQRENFPDAEKAICPRAFGQHIADSCGACWDCAERMISIPADIAEKLGIKLRGAEE